MVAPKKIIMKDLELADEEIARLRKENKELKVNYNKALSDVVTLTEENKELKAKNRALELRLEKALVFNI